MKVAIINKSDSTGGAAVVSRRLMEALRLQGVEAKMLVCEKLTDSPFVIKAASDSSMKRTFLWERLKIFFANGFNRSTLFKIDSGETGLPLWKNPVVKEADAILINWVNQGMLSLKGLKKILRLGKPVIITMHDMWWMTGICHHAESCQKYTESCGNCPLLGSKAGKEDLSEKVYKIKSKLYSRRDLMKKTAFVAVSTWLQGKARMSSLLKTQRVEVIPNAFSINSNETAGQSGNSTSAVRILFGAARLDDPVKGLDTLRRATVLLKENYPEFAGQMELAMFGNVKDESSLDGFGLPVVRLGVLKGEESVAKAYRGSLITVSSSSYETLPGTLVEAQAYGSVPVSFDRGGQRDIIEHRKTGYIAKYDEDPDKRAANLAEGIIWAFQQAHNPGNIREIRERMKKNVEDKFSYAGVAERYISLIRELS